jgi:hypothetical protein
LVEPTVVWRTGQSGAPPDTVRCASHVTRPLELLTTGPLDSPVMHQTVTIHCLVCLLRLL